MSAIVLAQMREITHMITINKSLMVQRRVPRMLVNETNSNILVFRLNEKVTGDVKRVDTVSLILAL